MLMVTTAALRVVLTMRAAAFNEELVAVTANALVFVLTLIVAVANTTMVATRAATLQSGTP
jgi:uncharacterized integral membrane protein